MLHLHQEPLNQATIHSGDAKNLCYVEYSSSNIIERRTSVLFALEGAQYDSQPLGTLPTPCSTRAYQELAPNSRESGAGLQYCRGVWACSRRVSALLSESGNRAGNSEPRADLPVRP